MANAAIAGGDEVRVLVVDDDPDLAEVLSLILSRDGYSVSIAHNGREAMEAVRSSPPHCVLLDVRMPGLNGAELASQVRALHGDDVILIAMTGHSSTDTMVAAAFGRVDHYLQKPIDPAKLGKVLPPLR